MDITWRLWSARIALRLRFLALLVALFLHEQTVLLLDHLVQICLFIVNLLLEATRFCLVLLKTSLVLLQLILHFHLAQEVLTLSEFAIGLSNGRACAQTFMLGFTLCLTVGHRDS